MAHTPGPWKVGGFESFDGLSGVPFRCVYRSDDETARTRIYVWGGDTEDEKGPTFDCDSDAHLIAAAPQLLAALEKVAHFVEYEIDIYPEQYDALCALIRKARGET